MTGKQAAIKVVKRLRSSGYTALFAGGCVRDMLLARPAKDFDVATNAQPRDVVRLFTSTLKVGAKFGVVIVLFDGRQVEVATFRTESGYVDGRHPTEVRYAGPAEDARRRDFTINGMFYDPIEKKVIDFVNGRADLENRIIRTIGVPEHRFAEDYLRMLRAVRFSTQLGFAVEAKTKAAICTNAQKISAISGERIAAELEEILAHPNRAAGASMFLDTGLADAVFSDLSAAHSRFALKVLAQLRKRVDFPLALASFFAGYPSEFVLDKIRLLKLSRNQVRHLKFLLNNLLQEDPSLGRLRMLLAEPYFWDLYEFQRAVQKARDRSRSALAPLIRLRRRIRQLGDIELRPRPLLNGYDLIRLGAAPL